MAANKTIALILMATLVSFCISGTGAEDTCTASYLCTYSAAYQACKGWWWWRRCTTAYRMKYKTCSKCCPGYDGPDCTKPPVRVDP